MVGVSKGPQGQHARTKQHGRSTTEFECYISRASEGKARRMGSCTYHFGTKEPQPVLKEGRMNRVLIYPGAFNPPHRGHMLILQHGFYESGEDFNAMAAIVLLKDDDYLEYKNCASKRELLLTESERDSLWRTDVNLPDWAWTITDDYDSLYTLQQELVRIANLDGFDLEFVLLVGPDNFSHCKQLQRYDRYCDKILVSTAARTPTDYSPLTGPSKISNCTIWRPITALKRKTHATTESLSWLYPDEEAPLPTSQNLTTQIWECHAHGDVDLTARYLYTPPTLPDHSAIELVSATQIHAAIKTTTKAESTAYIEKYALDPTYLKQQLARRDNGTYKVQQEILEAEKALKHLTFEDIVAGKVRDCDSDDEGECWHEANQRRQAEYRREDQVTAAYASFPFCLQSNIMGKRHRNIDRRSTKENLPSTDEDEEDEDDNDQQPDEGDLSFEETMYLRVPTRKDRIPVHKPEYGNANAWPPS